MWVRAERSLAGTDPVPLRSGCDPGSWLRPPSLEVSGDSVFSRRTALGQRTLRWFS